jgi:hypothetical protein
MRNALTADELIAEAARRIGLSPHATDALFEGVPRDFPVRIHRKLPMRADLLGMIGITLFGTVHILERALRYSPHDILSLLRHEAEHVRQQRRSGTLFYVRYIFDWVRLVVHPDPGEPARGWRARIDGAYLGIGFEREAYAAEQRARELLGAILTQTDSMTTR